MLQMWRKTNFERFWFISFLFDNFRNKMVFYIFIYFLYFLIIFYHKNTYKNIQ